MFICNSTRLSNNYVRVNTDKSQIKGSNIINSVKIDKKPICKTHKTKLCCEVDQKLNAPLKDEAQHTTELP